MEPTSSTAGSSSDTSDETTNPGSTPKNKAAKGKNAGKIIVNSDNNFSLSPLLLKGVQYVTFMNDAKGAAKNLEDFLVEAIARQLNHARKQGVEFPPKMEAELISQGLLSS